MTAKKTVGTEERLKVRTWTEEIVRRFDRGGLRFDFLERHLPTIIEGQQSSEKRGEKQDNRAETRRLELETAFHSVGLLFGVSIPMPLVKGKEIPNREFVRRDKKGQALFVQPPKHLWTYDGHMKAFGQGGHWTVTDNNARAKIAWEPTNDWRWFWAEVECGKNNKEDCPRLGTSWNDLTKKVRLLSLEEYVLVWHLHKAITGKMLDISFWCWLRTRWNVSGALNAREYDGEVRVYRSGADDLETAYPLEGGRVAEVVK